MRVIGEVSYKGSKIRHWKSWSSKSWHSHSKSWKSWKSSDSC
ncbi:hypothetical protein [Modestobacter sp. I12A-02662]